jgi:hypothetical protein
MSLCDVGLRHPMRFFILLLLLSFALAGDLARAQGWVQVAPPSPIPLQTLAFPQPETASQEIEYSLPQLQHVTVRVYDLSGHVIQTLLDKELQSAGEHRVTFRGDGLPAGTYIYHIDTERYHASGKSVLVK